MCAGYGGIGLGLKNIFGERLRAIAYCELEGFAQANLISKMEKGLLDVAPIWSDLKTFPYGSFHGLVDILIAGYPCQPFSAAGKRAGKDDPRHLWPWIADGIRLLRPRLCFFENVEGHISLGLREVIGELESIGYQSSWGIFSASEVGAPHQRKRVFILAHRKCEGLEGWVSRMQPASNGCGTSSDISESSNLLANAMCNGSGESWLVRQGSDGSEPVSDGESRGVIELANAGRLEPQGWGGAADGQQSGAGRIPRSEPAPRHDQVWPSRPGQPQHGWEPPRVVVANAANHGHAASASGGGICGDEQDARRQEESQGVEQLAGGGSFAGLSSELAHPAGQRSGSESGDALHEGWTTSKTGRESLPQDSGWPDGAAIPDNQSTGGDGAELGNADHGRLASGIDAGSSTEADRGGQSDIEQADGGLGDAATSRRPQHQPRFNDPQNDPCTTDQNEHGGQAQPEMGRDADGSAGGMGYAELQVTCDNRTDELRLLGNGVVPATAERAFLTLLEELFQQQPTN